MKLAQALLIGEGSAARTEDWWRGTWGLSPREVEVARLAARGFSNPDVAELLRVSPHTVRNQLASVFRKADVTTRAELAFAMNGSPELELPRPPRRQRGAWSRFLAAAGVAALR
ncbi:MAG TPA: helix-turn-helix transcriptional regulator [Polyangiaceae bacterium]